MSANEAVLQGTGTILGAADEIEEADTETDDSDAPGEPQQDDDDDDEPENGMEITIQTVSISGSGQLLARPPNLRTTPESHAPGTSHIILASFLAFLCGCDIAIALSWARAGGFIELIWNLTGYDFPRITTRHAVVENGNADVGLSGGTGFALKLLNNLQTIGLACPFVPRGQPPDRDHRDFPEYPDRIPGRSNKMYFGRRRQPLYSQGWDDAPQSPEFEPGSTSSEPQSLLSSALLPLLDDHTSVSTDSAESVNTPSMTMATTASTCLDDSGVFFNLLSTSPAELTDTDAPRLDCRGLSKKDSWTLDPLPLVNRRLQSETVYQQRTKAETIYARNGDTREMVSLMSSVTGDPFIYCPSSLGGF